MNMHAMFRSEGGSVDDAAPGGRLKPRWLRKPWVIACAVLAVLLLLYLIFGRGHTPPPPVAEVPSVTVIVPGRSQVSAVVTGTGSLSATRDMPVGVSGEGGEVERVLVDAGDRVAAGQVLARIDTSVQVQQANQLAASIRAAKADADLAASELTRAEALVSRGFISKSLIDQKRATRDAARARVAVAQAQLAEMNARIERLAIRAPAAGLVLERSVEPGQIVSSGGSPLFRIAKDGQVELRARLAEQEMNRLKVGMPAKVTPVGRAEAVDGSVWLLSPAIDPQTRQGEARIALKADPSIRPGGFAKAQIMAGSADQPVVPESAVLNDAKGSYVMIVGPDNKVQRRAVTLGEISNTGVAIASGLTGNEKVIQSAGAFLTVDETVKPVRAAAR